MMERNDASMFVFVDVVFVFFFLQVLRSKSSKCYWKRGFLMSQYDLIIMLYVLKDVLSVHGGTYL